MDPSTARAPRMRPRTAGLAAALLATLAGTGVATAGGGLGTPEEPVVTDVRCLESCLDVRTATEGSKAEIAGTQLESVVAVRLRGVPTRIPARPMNDGSVHFFVPEGATSGKPVVIDSYENRVKSPVELAVGSGNRLDDAEGFRVRAAAAKPRKAYFAGKRRSKVDYLFEADGPTDVRIDVLKGKSGKLVDSIVTDDAEPFTNLSAGWNGKTEAGKIAPNGRYRYEITPLAGGAEPASAAFEFHDHKFPVRGPHDYGDGLGAGRGHQGQDVFAKCGTPIVAARGGRVQASEYHSSAGYYVVIDGAKTGVDYAYMHLNPKGLPEKGDKVKTGERIGLEDDTGNASGCHLHFEMWSAPGWYEGGDVIDPSPALRKWDRWS